VLRPIGVRQQGYPQTVYPRLVCNGATGGFIVNQDQLLSCPGGQSAALATKKLEVGKAEAQQDQYGNDLH